ncbi:hypothetical protein BC829DRAFT_391965, partial [Chytridium lagenaria]
MQDKLIHALNRLSHEARDYGSTELHHLPSPPSSLLFSRMISEGRPVLINNATSHWPAMTKWLDLSYLSTKLGAAQLTVAVTPN